MNNQPFAAAVKSQGRPSLFQRGCAYLMALSFLVPAILPVSALAAELIIEDGVVVKFGPNAQMVVRDKLTTGAAVTLTSIDDDSAAGRTGATAQTAVPASWQGLRIEKSTQAFGTASFTDLSVRFAGSGNGAALTIRSASPVLRYLQLNDNSTGLRLLDASNPSITGATFLRNSVGIDALGGSVPGITGSQFSQNSTAAIVNATPATAIQATGNWWGHPSGPRDAVVNPQGQGDAVSAGVNFGSYLAQAPLLNPSIRLAAPAPYYSTPAIALELSCLNATEYRIAENDAYASANFSPLANGKASVTYNASAGDGRKNIGVQFRSASGAIVSASLVNPAAGGSAGVLIDGSAPGVAINNPAPGSILSQPIVIEASVSDAGGVAKIEFFIDGILVSTQTTISSNGLYTYAWNTDASANGEHTLRVVATDAVGRATEQSRTATVSRTPPPPDTTGPVIANATFSGVVLGNSTTISRDGAVTVEVTDRSGVARIELLLDGQTILSPVSQGGGKFGGSFSIAGVANGPHTLAWRAVDSLNNVSSVSFQVTVAHGAPDTPTLVSPAGSLTTRDSALTVSGLAPAGSSVQLFVNGQPVGNPVTASSGGNFSGNVSLASGANQIQARTADAYGQSALSSPVTVTLDISVPSSPSNLAALALSDGKVRLSWTRSADPNAQGYNLYRSRSPFDDIGGATKVNASLMQGAAYEDLPTGDGLWYYRLVGVNAIGTPSAATNLAQANADGTPPKAISVAYSPLGKKDPVTGRIGQGRVNLVLTTNEELQAAPYLAIVPAGGSPIVVDLTKASLTTYNGFFTVDASTPSGTANALFSARDLVGNRGTDIQSGATLRIDTEGPSLSSIVLNPTAPIRADASSTVQGTFTFSKALKSGTQPQLKFLLSGPVRQPVAVGSLSQINGTTYAATVQLPSDAGLGSPENLSFTIQTMDDLDNISTRVSAANRFQVYQGNLPPSPVPLLLTGKAQPGGKVKLNWQAVDDAFAYQVYRQGPSASTLTPLARASGVDYVDTTPADGRYTYAVASVRQVNGQESTSGQSASVEVVSSASAPGAPQNLALLLTGQGIRATWQPPLASAVDYYNLYRAAGTGISNITGLTPIKTRVKSAITYDPSPSPLQGAYVVTAVDVAGNESALSNSAYLNASLLPVVNLRIEQIGNSLPVVSWQAPNGNLSGYNVYLGPDAARTKLTPSPISATTFSDTGFTGGERRYTVASVDSTGQEIARSLALPAVTTQIVAGLPVKRGVMNRLQVQVANTSASTVSNARVVVRLPINRESTQFKDHKSDEFALGANETRLITVIVGGYADLPGQPAAQVGIESTPNEGESIKIARNQTVDVGDSALVVGMATGEFTRGATGKVRLTIENTSEVEVELLTASGNGTAESSDLRFKILDADGNVLATQAYKQAVGGNVITLTNGQTVARIPAGATYTSDQFDLAVPASTPKSIRVRLEVDKMRYHTGQEDEIAIAGRGSERTVSLIDTAYLGEVTSVSPLSSFGDQDIIIAGKAVDRQTSQLLPNARLKLILNQQGFERVLSVLTDASGNFSYVFKPTVTDAGLYKVSAIHPDLTDRPEQRSFTINRVVFGPTPFTVDVPRNYSYAIPFIARSGAGTSATNIRLALEASAQPTGQLPAGVTLQLPSPVSMGERSQLNIPVAFSANNDALPSGGIILTVYSDERPQGGGNPLGQVRIDYTLSEAKPFLVSTPSLIETGLSQGSSQVESISVQNKGLQDAANLVFTLTKPDGTAAPSWVSISSSPNGSLAVGAKRSVDIAFAPPSSVAEGVYEFRLNVTGTNVPAQALNVYASVTQSGQGNLLFKASDIYTATLDKQGRLIAGLGGAAITLQNEDVASVTREIATDSLGEAYFQNVPAGRYTFRARANNHQEVAGRLQIKPGITQTQPIFLDYNLINVEWSVREITIQDRYEITIDATFETDVPAAVVVMQPSAINLPKMKAGDVFFGELTLTNHGLIRADNVKQKPPATDAFFRFEFLVEVPTQLQAKQRVTIPYRVVALQSLDTPADAGNASGGGCYSYSNTTETTCTFICRNGVQAMCNTKTSWFSIENNCSVGGGGTVGGIGASGGGLGGIFGIGGGGSFGGLTGGTSTPIDLGRKCIGLPDGKTQCN